MPKSRLNLSGFLKELSIPPAEHDAVANCVNQALDAAERQDWGRSYGAPVRPADLLRIPHLLGYLAVEVVRHPALSADTKRKVVGYTLQRARPLEDNGTPRGLTVLLSYLAAAGVLDLASFTAAIKTAEIERALFDVIKVEELAVLSDWLLGHPELDDQQRLWWLWFLVGNCGNHRLGQPWIDHLLAHPVPSNDFKRALCQAWLSDRPPGPAPESWRALDQALMAGLGEAAPELAGDLDGPLLSLLDDDEDEEAGDADDDHLMASMSVVSHLMRSALGGYVLIPPYVQRRAVLGLAQAGEDPLAVCQRFLDSDRREDTGALNQGVADVLGAFHSQLPPDEVKALIERGQSLPQTATRKAFYALAASLYGPAVWERAQRDSAASVRAWAAKQAGAARR